MASAGTGGTQAIDWARVQREQGARRARDPGAFDRQEAAELDRWRRQQRLQRQRREAAQLQQRAVRGELNDAYLDADGEWLFDI